MAFRRREKKHFSQKENQGVRGSVAYREMSDSYMNDAHYTRGFFFIVNAVLVLFALAVLGVICWHFAVPDASRAAGYEDREIQYTLTFYDINGAMASSPAVGTSLIDPATGAVLGEITALYAEPATVTAQVFRDEWQTMPENLPASTVELSAKIVTVTVCTKAAYREGQGYTKNGVRLAMGCSYTVSFAGTVASGICTALIKGDAE